MSKIWQDKMKNMTRSISPGVSGDEDLGPFKWLPQGVWQNNGKQFGFNIIALPFKDADQAESRGYRVLTNKYLEALEFTTVDKAVPNRGVEPASECENDTDLVEKCHKSDNIEPGKFTTVDQRVLTLNYIQMISQVEAISFPDVPTEDGSKETGTVCKKIHHEPGLFLRTTNPVETIIQRKPTVRNIPLNLARLATIPHGNSVLALGSCEILEYSKKELKKITDAINGDEADDAMREYLAIPEDSILMGMPQGTTQDLVNAGYLEPYRETIIDKGTDDEFNPVVPQARLFKDLKKALGVENFKINGDFPIKRTTKIYFDTDFGTGGILNIPFVTRQANAAAMRATFWIHELDEPVGDTEPKLILQYLQTVILDFHVIRSDDLPGRIRWPHISINTMIKGVHKPRDPCEETQSKI
ncbi:MAG: heme-binding protein [Candidatus Thiothrix sulfatifontis]|nr:MAG: heme-binding protein [Candidatus Thiothrix sulfatifontis]